MVYDIKENNKRRRKERTDWLRNYKVKTGCQMCGYKEHPEILVFHHKELVRRKWKGKRVHGSMSSRNLYGESMKKELKKCLLLCPNCHAWIHFEDNNFTY